MEKNFKNLFDERKKLSKELDKTYIDMIENINNRVNQMIQKKYCKKIFLKRVLWMLQVKQLEHFLIQVTIT